MVLRYLILILKNLNSSFKLGAKKWEANIIRIQNAKTLFVMIDKGFIGNPKLSAKAKGALVYLLSLPPNWELKVKADMKHFTDGELSICNGLKRTDAARLCSYMSERIRDEQGTFGHQSLVNFLKPRRVRGVMNHLNPNSTSFCSKKLAMFMPGHH